MNRNIFRFFSAVTFLFSLFSYADRNSTFEEIFWEESILPLNPMSDFYISFPNFWSEIIRDYHFDKVIDAGCGTPYWIKDLKIPFQYFGIDILKPLIELNLNLIKNDKANFYEMDMTHEIIPEADLVFCRDCLEYFSYFDIYCALENFKSSQSSYLILSTFPEENQNKETSTGIKRNINFEKAPFFFPRPLKTFKSEHSKEECLAMWDLKTLDLSFFKKFIFPPLTIMSKPVGKPLEWEHSAVANSLRRGLPKVHRDYNINPGRISLVKENVVVIADINAGKQAYEWKKKKKIKTLRVGPNIVPNPQAYNFFITLPLIDSFLSPSQWITDNFIRFDPALKGRIQIWFAGIDEKYWNPLLKFKEKSNHNVLLYQKNNPNLSAQVESSLQRHGYKVTSLKYGEYSLDDYRKALSEAKFSVFLSDSESQGIALAESWAMDVPTLVWNQKGTIEWGGNVYTDLDSAPYLEPMTGKKWETIEDFERLLFSFPNYSNDFQPRRWVLLHMTDKISVECLLSSIRGEILPLKQ